MTVATADALGPSTGISLGAPGTTRGPWSSPTSAAANYPQVHTFADGRRLATSLTLGSEPPHVYVVDIERKLLTRLNPEIPYDYAAAPSPDDTVAFTHTPDGPSADIWVRTANGVGEARLLVSSPTIKHANSWSPDGRWLMYDDHVPGFAPDGTLTAVPVRPGRPFEVGEPKPLFRQAVTGYVPYDVLPNGDLVLNARVPEAEIGGLEIHVLLNWQSMLTREP